MRIKRVVIGMDFSTPAIAAARWVTEEFAPEAEVILLSVVDPPPRPPFGGLHLPAEEDILKAAISFAEDRLQELNAYLSPGTGRRVIRVGTPHEVLASAAEELKADLLVVGPHGDRPRPWKLLGTTAERLVRASRVPVIVAGSPVNSPPKDILAGVDDSSITPAVMHWVRALAKHFDSDVTLMHVLSNAVYSHVESMAHAHHTQDDDAAAKETRAQMEIDGVRWLEKLAGEDGGFEIATAAVTFGNPADALLAMAETIGSDLIVMGRHGAGTVAPALLGSTLGTVLHGARCPVLVVTGEPPAGE